MEKKERSKWIEIVQNTRNKRGSMATPKHGCYPMHRQEGVDASVDFPQLERDILAYWKENDTFACSIRQRDAGKNGSNEYVFYDGPPFANGLPHYGHLLTGYVKDIVARYQTQLGRRVERRFGWDTHGLPAELEAERILHIEDKSEIENTIGIEKFNETCRSSVLTYTKEWQDYVTRQARWVDFDNDYKTMDIDYMESVIWAFKTLYDKGLAYEGYRVLPYCWNDQTPLSNHELRMDDDVYQDRQDQTVTVGMRMETGELALIWTTTPWTLPSNLAIAVGPDIDYVVVHVGDDGDRDLVNEKVIIAQARMNDYARELGEKYTIVEHLSGQQLVGRRYAPIFDYFEGRPDDEAPGPNAWTIIPADFVSTEDGTGLVHIAPAFGEDDMNVCLAHDIHAVVPVDEAGRFTSEVPDYEGQQVFETNKKIIHDIRYGTGPIEHLDKSRRAVLVRLASYNHSYPHCWRCRKPLIYKAVSSWFVKVTAFRDRMVELNQQITWVPDYIKDGIFGKWLQGARDWSISRNRYWGSPIPVWKSDDPRYPRIDVYGSLAELEKDFGCRVNDLHRPAIDKLVRPNPDDPTGKSMMRRIPDVLDCWFDSGSMPYAQVHYPFENQDWFQHHYPGDFIVEYIGQTRGWFYTLHVLATALFDRPAFTHCISHGIVLGDDGRKMSKSLRNYPDVNLVFDKYGSDAMRWFLMAAPVVRGGNLQVSEQGIRDTVRQVLLPLWNIYYFFTLYASTCNDGRGYQAHPFAFFGWKPSGSEDALEINSTPLSELDTMDRYALARTSQFIHHVHDCMDNMDIPGVCQATHDHLDMLTNWYIRTSRTRFWNEDTQAFDVLYTIIEATMRTIAPFAPLITEEIWRGITGGRSVHLSDFPVCEDVDDEELVATMDEVRSIVSAGHSLRKAHSLRVRQPLRSLRIVSTSKDTLLPFTSIIQEEVNVKKVELLAPEQSGLHIDEELCLYPKNFDPSIRRLTSALFKAQKAHEWHVEDNDVVFPTVVNADGESVRLGEKQYSLTTKVEAHDGQVATVLPSGAFIVMDTLLDETLKAEGIARDIIRTVQDKRKLDGFHVADRISAVLRLPAPQARAAQQFRDMIAAETLATQIKIEESDGDTVISLTKI